MSGGPRPSVSPASPDRTSFPSSYAPGTVVIDTSGRKLYLVQSPNHALVYPISVGRQGFQWTGTERISRMANWPDWNPPAEMRRRQPYLPVRMTGGLYNPLGAKALYLGNTLYRIHGTDNPRTIGRATSSGCFRMTNGHVIDLSRRVGVGTTVVVVNRLSGRTARVND
jgi:lipoprotein-anchoring transpeptidase ErfK/SrfK